MHSRDGIGRRAVLGSALALGACQATPAAPAPPTYTGPRLSSDGVGYIAIQATINDSTRALFDKDIEQILALQPRRIYVPIASGGGVVSAARGIIGTMDRVHGERGIPFTTHNIGTVASAACYIYLAGQQRLCVPRGTFLFHAETVAAIGVFTGEALQAQITRLNDDEAFFRKMLKSRTRLTDADATSFLHRTVILNAEEARRDGISDATADFKAGPDAVIGIIRAAPNPAARLPVRPAPLPATTG